MIPYIKASIYPSTRPELGFVVLGLQNPKPVKAESDTAGPGFGLGQP